MFKEYVKSNQISDISMKKAPVIIVNTTFIILILFLSLVVKKQTVLNEDGRPLYAFFYRLFLGLGPVQIASKQI